MWQASCILLWSALSNSSWVVIRKWRQWIFELGKKCERWIIQHDVSVGQRKYLCPRQESNPWPPEHIVSALSTELLCYVKKEKTRTHVFTKIVLICWWKYVFHLFRSQWVVTKPTMQQFHKMPATPSLSCAWRPRAGSRSMPHVCPCECIRICLKM